METVSVLCVFSHAYACFCRSGLVGDTKYQGIFFCGISRLSELEDVCGSLLYSQPHISPHLQTLHA